MFRGFLPKNVYFSSLQKSVFADFDFWILTKATALLKPTLVQNTQGGGVLSVPEGLPAGGCARYAIKIHFGGIYKWQEKFSLSRLFCVMQTSP
jgi:hypothetical protein